MNNRGFSLWDQFQEKWLSRRGLIRGAAGTMLGADFFRPKVVHASDDDGEEEQSACVGPSPIPGGAVGLKPYGIFIHHNPLNPAKALADISDPSQITDFDGFVGLTHIRGGGMGTDTTSGAMTGLAFQADMGFNQGKFIGSASVYKQIHDYNVHVDRNDVFCMIPVRHDAVQDDFDSQRARLRVRGMDVFDCLVR